MGAFEAAEKAQRLRQEARKLAKELDVGYMRLAKKIYQIEGTPALHGQSDACVVVDWGYKDVSHWAEAELGMQTRKVRFLRRIYEILEVELDLDARLKERIIRLGYSKVRELVGVLTEENAKAWLDQIEGCTYAEVSRAIREYRAEQREKEASGEDDTDADPREVQEVSYERFALYPDQLDMVKAALEVAKRTTGSSKKSHRLTLICMDFLATNGGADKTNIQMFRQYFANLERLFGVEIVVSDPSAPAPQNLMYGREALDKIAEKVSESMQENAEDFAF